MKKYYPIAANKTTVFRKCNDYAIKSEFKNNV